MNENTLQIHQDQIKLFNDAYTYGNYTSMTWLKEKIIELKKYVKNHGVIIIDGYGDISTLFDLMNWVEKSYREVFDEINWID